jgi:dolichol-phosphate mannosyltransferase
MGNKEKNFVSAIIYVHNAEKRIEQFLNTAINVLEENFEHSEIICVNDSSSDESLTRIKNVSQNAASASISVVNMSYYHGLEAAMNAGMDLAIGDFVFEFDNTVLDFPEEEIMRVYRRSLQGYDIVSAVPDKTEKLTSKLFYSVFDKFTDQSYEMHTESFRILSRRVINRISSMNTTIPYRKAIYASQGLKTDALKYQVIEVRDGKPDKAEKRYRSGLAIDSLILFTELGYRFSMTMTAIMMLMSVFMVVYSIIIFATANPVAGWTTTILFLSVAFFGLFGILTIIIKYLQLLVNLVFRRKHYSFEGIEKLTK